MNENDVFVKFNVWDSLQRMHKIVYYSIDFFWYNVVVDTVVDSLEGNHARITTILSFSDGANHIEIFVKETPEEVLAEIRAGNQKYNEALRAKHR